jgi:hypothetical protein
LEGVKGGLCVAGGDVAPAESEDLAASYPGVRGEPQCGVVTVSSGAGEELVELVCGPDS